MEQKKRVMLVFGTRPEAIKVAPLVKAFQKHTERFETIVCVTGQHREMLDQVLHLFEITPDYDLNIMKQGQDLYDVTARVITGLRDVYKEANPDVVFVHGDTTTSMAAALAAFYQQIPVAHIEAGLRTHNIYSPWPEEMNRQITSRIAEYNLAPTPLSKENLLKEGVKEETITVTGNTVIDALYLVVDKIKQDASLTGALQEQLKKAGYDTDRLKEGKKLVLITGHRRENFGEGFYFMCNAIKTLTEKYPEVDFVYPMHLNPNVRKPILEIFGEEAVSGTSGSERNIFFIEPLEYLPFVFLREEKPSLGNGELACIVYSKNKLLAVLTDDKTARNYTKRLFGEKKAYETAEIVANMVFTHSITDDECMNIISEEVESRSNMDKPYFEAYQQALRGALFEGR